MRQTAIRLLTLGAAAMSFAAHPALSQVPPGPAFRVDAASPTKDKPQSKLWYDRGSWWAWLPVRGGSAIWRRTSEGWKRQPALDGALQGWPGQADVWKGRGRICAALTGGARLAAACLQWDEKTGSYALEGAPALLEPGGKPADEQAIETATIAADAEGRLWVAYTLGEQVWTRNRGPGAAAQWSAPARINGSPVSPDDICAITALPTGVGVMWSDQRHDAVYFRSHATASPATEWGPVETVDAGNKTADDHIHLAVAQDGTLYAATKNSLDAVGQPQLVLRVRGRNGGWTNIPYAPRTSDAEPSRPIVLLNASGSRLHLLHTLYGRKPGAERWSAIAWQASATSTIRLEPDARIVMDAGRRLNDVTSSKTAPPPGVEWIVLASDPEGNVYEASIGTAR